MSVKTQVTDQGLLIPKDWFNGAHEAEIRREKDTIIVTPLPRIDPIRNLGSRPVSVDVTDASENHDEYLYDQ